MPASLRPPVRVGPGAVGILVLLFNVLWYGRFLSFPLIGEDGAANYSFLLENFQGRNPFTTSFPIKWLEGLGQPNPFVTVTFDPFSWLMLLPLDAADAFRLSMAVRATTCWFATFLFVRALFKGRNDVAMLAATVNMVISFTLGHSRGVPTVAGIPNATHYAVFPLLLWAAMAVARQRSRVGAADIWLGLSLAFFLITFPLSSLIGMGVLGVFATTLVIASRSDRRGLATIGLGKIGLIAALFLLAPQFGLWHAWSAVLTVSARSVFSEELYAYGRSYSPPYFWHDVPWAIKACILLALLPLLSARKWPRPVWVVVLVLFIVVIGVQVWTVAQAKGWFGGWLDRLPRPHYFEFYLPTFYAIAAAFGVRYWSTIRPPSPRLDEAVEWVLCVCFVCLCVFAIAFDGLKAWRGALIGLPVAMLWLGVFRFFSGKGTPFTKRPPVLQRSVAYAVVLALPIAAAWTWMSKHQSFHPMFGGPCKTGMLWCHDDPGMSIGAGPTPITAFIGTALSSDKRFMGRAESLLVPSPRIAFPELAPAQWSPEIFEKMKSWYRSAHAAQPLRFDHPQFHLKRDPDGWQWKDREELQFRLRAMAANGDIYYGVLPEDVVKEMLEWANSRTGVNGPPALLKALKLSEVQIMVEDRNRAFADTGNGMLLRALPLQGIPVASSYEQSLDYLYFLFWTRYLNEGGGARYIRSINFTALETVHPDRLALIGVRYIIARQSSFNEPPDLPKVFAWRGYAVYAVPGPNLSGFGVTSVRFGGNLEQELRAMREQAFNPRVAAVVPAADRRHFEGRALSPLRMSRLAVEADELVFEGESSGVASFAVLPFKYSACWLAEWEQGAGNIVRADVGLIGVLFSGRASVRLRWRGGYGSYDCLRRDAAMIPAASRAARSIPN